MNHFFTTDVRNRHSWFWLFLLVVLVLLYQVTAVSAQCTYGGPPLTVDFEDEATNQPLNNGVTFDGVSFSGLGANSRFTVLLNPSSGGKVLAMRDLGFFGAPEGTSMFDISLTTGCRFTFSKITVSNLAMGDYTYSVEYLLDGNTVAGPFPFAMGMFTTTDLSLPDATYDEIKIYSPSSSGFAMEGLVIEELQIESGVDAVPPTIVTNNGLNLNEGALAAIPLDSLEANDAEVENATLAFTVTTPPENGRLENSDTPGEAIASFTQQNLIDGKIGYRHDDSNTLADAFIFSVSDGTNELTAQTFSITVNPVDDDTPTIVTNNGLNLDEGALVVIPVDTLEANDTDSDNATLAFTVTTPPANGQLENSDTPGDAIVSFTQQNLIDGKIGYQHNDSNTLADSFIFKVSDGTNELTDQTFSIAVNPVDDDAPTIVNNNELLVPEEHYTAGIDTTLLLATDTEAEDTGLSYKVTTPPVNGQLENSDNAGIAVTAFTQQDIIDGKIGYHHTVDNTVADSLIFGVSDSNTNVLGNQVFRIAIQVKPKVARFTASPLNGVAGTVVKFQNNCGAQVNRFCWDFGDGQQLLSRNKQNPTHKYSEVGTYTVTLITWGWTEAAPETLVVEDMICISDASAALSIVDSTETHLNYGWNRVIDGNIVGTNCKMTADLPDVSCTFTFTDSVKRVVDNVRLFIDDVEKRNYPGHLTRKFEVWTSVDNTTWTEALAGEVRNRGVFETFSFEPAVCRYVKLKLVEPRNPGAQIIQLTEFQVFGTPVQEMALAKGLETENAPVEEFMLEQNYPNPFNPTTQIALAVPEECHVKVQVYNTVGQKVTELVNGQLPAGRYNLTFDAHNLPGGVYFYRIEAGSYHAVRRMVLLK